jgi:NADPH:quinone reductase-like Zn-dependent oxidoreductase
MADKTHAELCVAPASSLAKIPVGIDLVEAAALPLVTTTGNMLITIGTSIKADSPGTGCPDRAPGPEPRYRIPYLALR